MELIYTILDLFRIVKRGNLFSKKFYDSINHNKRLRILGNGKSLNENQLTKEDDVDYMVVNRHVIDKSYSIICPKYYVLADPYFFNVEEGIECLKMINCYTTWEMFLFIPNVEKSIKEVFDNPKIHIHHYNSTIFRGFESLKYFLYKNALSMPRVQNVLVGAIMIGILLKYQNIELYGVEHSWTKFLTVGNDNIVYIEDAHFYDTVKVKDKPFRDANGKLMSFGYVLECFSKMFRSYEDIQNFIRKQQLNINILNKTQGSYIDAFEREL
jgi:hypothetical protein